MKTVSLLGVASYLPERIVGNDYFGAGTDDRRGMFTAPKTRHQVAPDESAVDMMERAARRLVERLALDPQKDIDLVFTNVAIPDQAFNGSGAEVAYRLGVKPIWVLDLHNTGCVSFVYMLELARLMLSTTAAKGALLCNVQNAAGRVFSQPGLRSEPHAPVPGDGCGVGYVTASETAPVLSVVRRCQGEFASDMIAQAKDGRRYWEPGPSPITLQFTEKRVAAITHRGNTIVPEVVHDACREAGVSVRDLDLLVTNQPNPIFLRNWREALELAPEKHHDTYAKNGNLFGAALPINLEDALACGKLKNGGLLAFGGFANAGDYAGAAVIRWPATQDAPRPET
jgi:3-oxoacyl-[acyl-carrier-protein] synthase-3